MRKSKQNQPIGGEETPGENVPQLALLLYCWCPHEVRVGGTAGTGDAWPVDGAGTVMGTGAGVAVARDGPQVGA